MVDITNITKKFDKEFLKPEHVKNATLAENGDTHFIFTNSGELKENTYKGKTSTRLQIEGRMNGTNYIYTPSKTVCRVLSSVLGEDTEKWIGAIANLKVGYFDTTDDEGLPCKKPKVDIATLPSDDPEKTLFDISKD